MTDLGFDPTTSNCKGPVLSTQLPADFMCLGPIYNLKLN